MAASDTNELRASLQSVLKDVESKAATIKHLQNALNAKSMTIDILSKHNKEGGDLETAISKAVESKTDALIRPKDAEIQRLMTLVDELKATQSLAPASNSEVGDGEQERLRLAGELAACKEELQNAIGGYDKAIKHAVNEALEVKRRERWELEEQHRQAVQSWQEDKTKLIAATEEGDRELASLKIKFEAEQRRASELGSDMRNYQQKAFELKSANDVLSSELDRVQEELQAMQVDHQHELDGLQRDREAQWKAVTEQIDSKVKEVRLAAESEKTGLLSEQAEEHERNRQRLRELIEESDTLRLKCDTQELELKALRETLGDDAEGVDAVSRCEGTVEIASPSKTRQVDEGRRERARALREQSKFAFDEMANRISEVREEAEVEKKRLEADFEQRLKERGARMLELMNANDTLQMQVETLERARDDLVSQRDELNRALREKERCATVAEADLECASEGKKEMQQKLACLMLALIFQRRAVGTAFSSFRQGVLQPRLRCGSEQDLDDARLDNCESLLEVSTVDEECADDIEDDEDDDDDEEDEDNTYGVDEFGQEEWAEMLRANTLNALFTGMDVVVQNSKTAAEDLQEQVQNIVTSLDMFPQLYSQQLQELDRMRKGKELRTFICILQSAMARCQRIVSAIIELSGRSDDVNGSLQNMIRVKWLEWNLRNLRTTGQQDILFKLQVLFKLQRSQMEKVRTDYEDVLDQYGEQCELNSQLAKQGEELKEELAQATRDLASARSAVASQHGAQPVEPPGEADSKASPAPKSMEGIHEMLNAIERDSIAEAATSEGVAVPKSGKGPGKGPGKGQGKGGAKQGTAPSSGAQESSEERPAPQTSPEAASAVPAPGGKGGKTGPAKGPPHPAAAQASPQDAAPENPSGSVGSEPPPPVPGKGGKKGSKTKGPPMPGTAQVATPDSEPEVQQPPSAKGKQGPPPPPGKGKGKGPPLPGSQQDGQPQDAGGSQPPAAGKGPPPPKGKGGGPPPPAGGKAGPPPAGGKGGPGKGGPPAAKAKGGKGKPGDLSEEAKEALKGPQPPKDMKSRAFHWTNVVGNRFATSIFAGIVDDMAVAKKDNVEAKPKSMRMRLNLDALTTAFFTRKAEDKPAGQDDGKAAKKKSVAQCLEPKKSQNVEIFLNGCGVTIQMVKSCVLELDDKAMGVDILGKVVDMYPEGDELATLKGFEKDNDPSVLPWGRAEQFLISVMNIPGFMLRAQCCITRGQFQEDIQGVAEDVAILNTCLTSIVKSTALPAIFALIMQIGNYLNYGSSKGAQRGFTLDTLPVLARVEGFADKTYTLVRFIMDTLESERKIREDAFEDMKLCDACSKVDFDDAVRRLGELEKAVDKVVGIMKPVSKETNDDSAGPSQLEDGNFEAAMRSFASASQEKLTAVRKQVEEVQSLTKTCIDMYAEKPKTPTLETMSKLATFRKDMEEARRQNLLAKAKKEKAEKRRAEKDNAAKSKRKVEETSNETAGQEDSGKSVVASPAPAAKEVAEFAEQISDLAPNSDSPANKDRIRRMKVVAQNEPRGGVAGSASQALAVLPDLPPGNDRERHTLGGAILERKTVSHLERKTLGPAERKTLGGASNLQTGRLSMGPAGRPEVLHVSKSGRLSIGAPAVSRKGPGREEIQKLLEAARDVRTNRS